MTDLILYRFTAIPTQNGISCHVVKYKPTKRIRYAHSFFREYSSFRVGISGMLFASDAKEAKKLALIAYRSEYRYKLESARKTAYTALWLNNAQLNGLITR